MDVIYLVDTIFYGECQAPHYELKEFDSLAKARDYYKALREEGMYQEDYNEFPTYIDTKLYTNDPMIKHYMVEGDDSLVFISCSGCVRKMQTCYCPS